MASMSIDRSVVDSSVKCYIPHQDLYVQLTLNIKSADHHMSRLKGMLSSYRS
jgi:hypothetical protein